MLNSQSCKNKQQKLVPNYCTEEGHTSQKAFHPQLPVFSTCATAWQNQYQQPQHRTDKRKRDSVVHGSSSRGGVLWNCEEVLQAHEMRERFDSCTENKPGLEHLTKGRTANILALQAQGLNAAAQLCVTERKQ